MSAAAGPSLERSLRIPVFGLDLRIEATFRSIFTNQLSDGPKPKFGKSSLKFHFFVVHFRYQNFDNLFTHSPEVVEGHALEAKLVHWSPPLVRAFRSPTCCGTTALIRKRPPMWRPSPVNVVSIVYARRRVGPLFFRRYAMKPTPMKPKSIMAQVEASGTAAVSVIVPVIFGSPRSILRSFTETVKLPPL